MGFHGATIATVPPGASLSIVGTVPTISGADALFAFYNADEVTTPLTKPSDFTLIDAYQFSAYDNNSAAIFSYTANSGAGFPSSGGPTTYTFTTPAQTFPSTSLLLLSWTGIGVTPTAAQSTVIASQHIAPTTAVLTGCACNPGDQILVFVAGDSVSLNTDVYTISATGYTSVSSGGDGYSPVAVLASNATASGSTTGNITISIASTPTGEDFGGVIAWVVAMPPSGGGTPAALVGRKAKAQDETAQDDYRAKSPAFLAVTARANVLLAVQRRPSDEMSDDGRARHVVAFVPAQVKAWAALAQIKRPQDDPPDDSRFVLRGAALSVPITQGSALALPRRAIDSDALDEVRRTRQIASANVLAVARLATMRKPAAEPEAEESITRRPLAKQAQAAQLLAQPKRFTDEGTTEESARRAQLSPAPLQQGTQLAQPKRFTDEGTTEESARRAQLSPAPLQQGTQLAQPKRLTDEGTTEDSARRAQLSPAPLQQGTQLAQPKRASDDPPDELTRVRRARVATSVNPWAALGSPRRTLEQEQPDDRVTHRGFIAAAAAQAITRLARPRVPVEAEPEETRVPSRRGRVAAAVNPWLALAPKRTAESELADDRRPRPGFVAAAVQALAQQVFASQRRPSEPEGSDERAPRRSFSVQALAQQVFAPQRRPSEPEGSDERAPRRSFSVQAIAAPVLSVLRRAYLVNDEQAQPEQRRGLLALIASIFSSLGGTVRVKSLTQSVSLASTQVQLVTTTARAQSVTVKGVESMYYVNTRIRMIFNFADFDGTAADPTTVALTIDGATVVPTRLSAGVWYYDYLPATTGTKLYTIAGTGAIAATRGGKIDILPD